MFGLGGLVSAGLDLAGDLWKQDRAEAMQDHAQNFARDQQLSSQEFNSAQAIAQRDWTERMSNTAYQRSTADLQKAGLNPMLAYHQGGAESKGGATASAGIAAGPGGTTPGRQHINLASTAAQIQNLEANTARTKSEQERTDAERREIEARTPTHAISIQQMQQTIKESEERIRKIIQETSTSQYSAAHLAQQTANLKAIIPQIEATVKQLRAQTKLTGAEEEKARMQTQLTQSQWGEVNQRIAANLPDLEKAIKELQARALNLEMPRRGMDAATHDSFLGALSAVLRALNPFANLSGSIR